MNSKMEACMSASGRMANDMARANKYGQMGPFTKDIGRIMLPSEGVD